MKGKQRKRRKKNKKESIQIYTTAKYSKKWEIPQTLTQDVNKNYLLWYKKNEWKKKITKKIFKILEKKKKKKKKISSRIIIIEETKK